MTRKEIQSRLQETAGELLRSGRVDLFIGHAKASLPLRCRPLVISRAEEAGELVWNSFCQNNLSVYLPGLFSGSIPIEREGDPESPLRIGLAVKPCDARSVRMLVQERQVDRERVVLVGLGCTGMIDRRKALAVLEGKEALGAGEDDSGDIHVVLEDGTETTLARDAVLADACLECALEGAGDCDLTIGQMTPPEGRGGPRADVESMTLEERWKRFSDGVSECIRCYACRQVCPLCYCKDCFADRTSPRWLGIGNCGSDLEGFHLIRAFHMAGRCTDCGACVAACPMGIDTRWLTRWLNRDAELIFGYRAGLSFDGKPLLCEFSMEDPQEFLTEP
ncbi:MAG: Coenzyme F420 hydrogenase/dehydrogenase, beta subunit C-terminal domain [Deltaproteobacteria bacterium]|nr:Coenzyme F420 hydrogenase/dehydrogenase, beta subunit C-terminal domain [Deltaproteobacteria bacterium]